jgi:hypothetical protein
VVYPAIAAGQRITASLLTSMLPQSVVKLADQSVTNSTALVNDSELFLPVVSGATYVGELLLYHLAPAANDLDYAWSTPAGSSGRRGVFGPDPTTTAVVDTTVFQDRVSAGLATEFTLGGAAGSHKLAIERFVLTAGANGTLRLQFAQGTAGAGTSATVLANSVLTLRRVS